MDRAVLTEYRPSGPERAAPASAGAAGYAYIAHPAAERERDVLRDLWGVIQRRWLIIVVVSFLTSMVSAAAITSIPPRYRTSSTVLLEARRIAPVKRDDPAAPPPTAEAVADELQVLQSRELLGQTVNRLKLTADPDFNWTLRPGRLAAFVEGAAEFAAPWAPPWTADALRGFVADAAQERAARYAGAEFDITVNSLRQALQVGAVGRSRAIEITVTALAPDKAATIANTVAELYIAAQTALREAELREVATWVTSQLSDLRARADTSARAVADYRASQGIVRGIARGDREADLVRQEVSEVASQLTAARAKRADLSARLTQAEKDRAAGNLDGLADVLGSRTIELLRAQEAQVAARQAEAATRLGGAHPSLAAARAELNDVRGTISREVQRIMLSLRNDLQVAGAAEHDLGQRLERLRADVARGDVVDVRLQELQREANADRALAESFLTRARQISAEVSFRDASARLVSRAPVPLQPHSPNTKILLPLALFLSYGAGGLAALLREIGSQGIRSADELERRLGLVPLGVIPLRRRRSDRLGSAMFDEAIAGFCAHLVKRPGGARPRSVLITSASPGEGKSTTARALAAEAAARGMRALLVDADLRHARRGASAPGLTEVLHGGATAEEAIRRDGGHWLLPAGERPPNPTQLLTSDAMENLLRQLEDGHDLVVIDSAPVLVGGDVGELSRCAAETILLVRWGHTRARAVDAALRRVAVAGGAVAGVVVTMVDPRKDAQYPHADAVAPLPALRRYYGVER